MISTHRRGSTKRHARRRHTAYSAWCQPRYPNRNPDSDASSSSDLCPVLGRFAASLVADASWKRPASLPVDPVKIKITDWLGLAARIE
jgi:hypothetical protein